MRLYTRTGATALDDAEYGTFHADENGGFDFPDDVSDRLQGFHLGGQPMWETDTERQRRLVIEEMDRRKDPATLLSAVEQLVRAAQATAALTPAVAEASAAVKELADVQKSEPGGDGDGDPAAQSQNPDTPVVVAPPAPAPEPVKPARKTTASKTTAK
jgi:hypothetical protein